ncbi:MAG: PIG-L family deacetylase [Chloroflexi bacterium]|nr:PIG-L family deacetylase [Chloroflexota bacterium]
MIGALFISPHFDDAVFSCGGQIYDRARRGERVVVATICAAPPPAGQLSPFAASLHERWSQSGLFNFDRAAEDRAALAVLGATPVHLNFHDCIYRRAPEGDWLYDSEAAIFGKLSPRESAMADEVAAALAAVGPLAPGAEIYLPFGVGNHVDHQLARLAAERWLSQTGQSFHHYADYPYAQSVAGGAEVAITESAKKAKLQAVRAYTSQLSSFWADDAKLTESAGNWTERLFD